MFAGDTLDRKLDISIAINFPFNDLVERNLRLFRLLERRLLGR